MAGIQVFQPFSTVFPGTLVENRMGSGAAGVQTGRCWHSRRDRTRSGWYGLRQMMAFQTTAQTAAKLFILCFCRCFGVSLYGVNITSFIVVVVVVSTSTRPDVCRGAGGPHRHVGVDNAVILQFQDLVTALVAS